MELAWYHNDGADKSIYVLPREHDIEWKNWNFIDSKTHIKQILGIRLKFLRVAEAWKLWQKLKTLMVEKIKIQISVKPLKSLKDSATPHDTLKYSYPWNWEN